MYGAREGTIKRDIATVHDNSSCLKTPQYGATLLEIPLLSTQQDTTNRAMDLATVYGSSASLKSLRSPQPPNCAPLLQLPTYRPASSPTQATSPSLLPPQPPDCAHLLQLAIMYGAWGDTTIRAMDLATVYGSSASFKSLLYGASFLETLLFGATFPKTLLWAPPSSGPSNLSPPSSEPLCAAPPSSGLSSAATASSSTSSSSPAPSRPC